VNRRAYVDTLGMWDATTAMPEQLSDALETAGSAFGASVLPTGAAVRAVAAFGQGTGGIACEAAAALVEPQLPVPFWVGHGEAVPAFVDRDTLVLVASCGDEGADTPAAAREAVARGAQVVAVGDGALAEVASDAGIPWCPVPAGPAGRAGLGAATVPLLVALGRSGLLPDPAPGIAAAAAALVRRRDALVAPGGAAEELARRIGRTIPLVYGSDGVTAVAGHWWKAQVNLNAKAPAFAAALPGLAHDELAGWGQGGDVTRQVMSLVLLRHGGESPRVAALFEAVRAATEEIMADVLDVEAEGEGELSRFFDLALLGGLVSLHLAAREGVDPGPAPAVSEAQASGVGS
jgi:glucose/mannose-6-phosphate isomerase